MNSRENGKRVVLDMKIARIIDIYGKEHTLSREEAADAYYNSVTAEMIEEGVGDLHCRSDRYLAEELWLEMQNNRKAADGDSCCGIFRDAKKE